MAFGLRLVRHFFLSFLSYNSQQGSQAFLTDALVHQINHMHAYLDGGGGDDGVKPCPAVHAAVDRIGQPSGPPDVSPLAIMHACRRHGMTALWLC
jgi:hypothetical protein